MRREWRGAGLDGGVLEDEPMQRYGRIPHDIGPAQLPGMGLVDGVTRWQGEDFYKSQEKVDWKRNYLPKRHCRSVRKRSHCPREDHYTWLLFGLLFCHSCCEKVKSRRPSVDM